MISPLVGTLNPAIIEKVVVLPAPFGPRRPTISPVLTSMEISRTTSLLPKVFLKFEANNVKNLSMLRNYLKFQSGSRNLSELGILTVGLLPTSPTTLAFQFLYPNDFISTDNAPF